MSLINLLVKGAFPGVLFLALLRAFMAAMSDSVNLLPDEQQNNSLFKVVYSQQQFLFRDHYYMTKPCIPKCITDQRKYISKENV